ncbi:MAG: alkaline phosphatase family protein, partial [Phycisphaerales bacterium]|nr:alkaline phosphatase family protein [Phycisphaerales bacterium]
MPDRLAKRVLVVGWDAADWKLIDPLLARGEMPHLARLIGNGCRADLASLDPKLSPLLWTSIATGKR